MNLYRQLLWSIIIAILQASTSPNVRCWTADRVSRLPSHTLTSGHRPDILRGDTKVLSNYPLGCSLAILQTLNYKSFYMQWESLFTISLLLKIQDTHQQFMFSGSYVLEHGTFYWSRMRANFYYFLHPKVFLLKLKLWPLACSSASAPRTAVIA